MILEPSAAEDQDKMLKTLPSKQKKTLRDQYQSAEDTCRAQSTEDICPDAHTLAKTSRELIRPCSWSSCTGPLLCLCLQPDHWLCHSMLNSSLQSDRGDQPPTSTRLCMRLGLVLPKALTGNSELNILFLCKAESKAGEPLPVKSFTHALICH